MVRRTLLVTALIAAAIAADITLLREPPPERAPRSYGNIAEQEPPSPPPDNNNNTTVAADIDATRNCLVLADGRDFLCDGQPTVQDYEAQRMRLIMLSVNSGHSDGTAASDEQRTWVAECTRDQVSETWASRYPNIAERQAWETAMQIVTNSEAQQTLDRLAEVVVLSVDVCIERVASHRF